MFATYQIVKPPIFKSNCYAMLLKLGLLLFIILMKMHNIVLKRKKMKKETMKVAFQ